MKLLQKSEVLSKDNILDLISNEKEKFNEYSLLCTHYKIQQDPLAVARYSSTIEALEMILKLLPK